MFELIGLLYGLGIAVTMYLIQRAIKREQNCIDRSGVFLVAINVVLGSVLWPLFWTMFLTMSLTEFLKIKLGD